MHFDNTIKIILNAWATNGKGRFLFHFIEHHPGVDIIFLIKHNEIPNILGK